MNFDLLARSSSSLDTLNRMMEVDMNLDDAEKEKYKKIKNRIYEHTNAYSNHLMVASAAVDRSASARLARDPPTCYYGIDTAPQGLAYTAYQGFDQAGSSRGPCVPRTGWEQQPQQSDGSWQQAPSGQWQAGNFETYHGGSAHFTFDSQEVSSEGQPHMHLGRASFSAPGYHEQMIERQQTNTLLRDLQKGQANMQH
jgi:hypothetical protein